MAFFFGDKFIDFMQKPPGYKHNMEPKFEEKNGKETITFTVGNPVQHRLNYAVYTPLTDECVKAMDKFMDVQAVGGDLSEAITEFNSHAAEYRMDIKKPTDKDKSGHAFSMLETDILQREGFSVFVNPSCGTINRLNRLNINTIKVYSVTHQGKAEREKHAEYLNLLVERIKEYKMTYEVVHATWQEVADASEKEHIYWGYHSDRMHEKSGRGFALEFNPNVASFLEMSMIREDEFEDYSTVVYSRNGKTFKFDYPHTNDYRIHGNVYYSAGTQPGVPLNLYNVVCPYQGTRKRITTSSVRDLAVVPNCIAVPLIDGTAALDLDGHSFVAATHQGVIVDIIEPAFELSTRRSLLDFYGYDIPKIGLRDDFSLLSSINSTYYNVVRDKSFLNVKMRKERVDYDVVRVGTNCTTRIRCHHGLVRATLDSKGSIIVGDKRYKLDPLGKSYLSFKDGAFKVVAIPKGFDRDGFLVDERMPYGTDEKGSYRLILDEQGECRYRTEPKIVIEDKCVTLLMSSVVRKKLAFHLATSVDDYGEYSVLTFNTFADKATFINNVTAHGLGHHLWKGDMSSESSLVRPESKKNIYIEIGVDYLETHPFRLKYTRSTKFRGDTNRMVDMMLLMHKDDKDCISVASREGNYVVTDHRKFPQVIKL